ncbi:MAG: thioredoxin-disulfide reductase [Rickettsiales bacterium]
MAKNHGEHKKVRVAIVGAGPAGYTAAIYAARANMEPVIFQGMQPGGQLTITTDVENYPGFAEAVQGPWLMEQMEAQARHVGTTIIFDAVSKVDFSARPFRLETDANGVYMADAVIVATGAQAKWLGLPSEKKFQGYGVSGCATCDGFFFKNKEVIVVGGGNTAVEEALYLTNHASKVTLVHRRDSLRAEKILQDRLLNHKKVSVQWNHVVDEVLGDDNPLGVTGARLKHAETGKTVDVPAHGVFIAIGHKPNTDLFKGQLDMDAEGYLVVKPGTAFTKIEGVFAAGDVADKTYRQAVTAAGTGCIAALDAERYLASLHNR